MAATRDRDGLTPKEAKIALYKAQGMTQSGAYRKAYQTTSTKSEIVNSSASAVFARPHVQARVRELLDAAKAQDILSVGRWADMVLEGVEMAREAGNMTAFFNGTRQLGQFVGALKDTVSMTLESKTDDAALVSKYAEGDKAKQAMLKAMLGAPDGFDQATVPEHETAQ